MHLPRLPDKPLYDILLLALLLALLFGALLGLRPYSVPSEARYIEIGREMAESGDFVTPRLNYVKYFEKPPLFYWIQAVHTKIFGTSPFFARVVTAKFTVLLCLITYGLGRMLYGRLAGWLSALTLATSLYTFCLSRIVLLDVPVSVFIVGTLTAFLYAAYAPEGRKRTVALYSMYAGAACAVLTKGLIGAVLPGAVIVIWIALTGRWALLARMRIISGTALFLLIAVPWHVLVALRNPEWTQFYFIHEHFERYLTTVHGRYQPDWFFAVVLLAGLFPWVFFAAQAAHSGLKGFWSARADDARPLFLVIWIAFIFIFFSLSDSKLIPYILPLFPPITVLLGKYLADVWNEKSAPWFKTGLFAMMVFLLAMSLAPMLLPPLVDAQSKVMVALSQSGDELHVLSYVSMIAAVTLLVIFIQARTRHVIVALVLIAAVIMQLGDLIGAHYNKDSMQALAGDIASLHKEGDEVASYGTYYQDLPVYLARRITVVNRKDELEFGTQHEDTTAWMIGDKEFWKRWLTKNHLMFVVMRDENFLRLLKGKKPEQLHFYPMRQDGRNVMVMNAPPTKPLAIKPK